MARKSVGEALIDLLEQAGVDTIFGIPGVHTIELYRGLENSPIRHVTPRHEQGAAFMADGYARVTGKPGVCLLITGPGLTNALTAMAQARADSIPMLVITGVNARDSLGKRRGHLHELPDQAALSRTICLETFTIMKPADLGDMFNAAFARMTSGRPGPVHIEVPLDVMKLPVDVPTFAPPSPPDHALSEADMEMAVDMCAAAETPLIILGGGATENPDHIRQLADLLDAPVVSTANARGIMTGHPLDVPASPSFTAIRELIATSDLVIALGTEIGPTDFDMYETGHMPPHPNMIRVDIAAEQFAKRDDKGLMIQARAATFLAALIPSLKQRKNGETGRAQTARESAQAALSPAYKAHIEWIESVYRAFPNAIIVGDSTQPIYAGNLMLSPPSAGVWFNSSSGFGTLGYATSAAIGAAIGAPDRPIICLIGDGGLQFTLAELGTAKDASVNVRFVVWNNAGYQEIETAMIDAKAAPIGVKPSAPDFTLIAQGYGLPARQVTDVTDVIAAMNDLPGPSLIDYRCA